MQLDLFGYMGYQLECGRCLRRVFKNLICITALERWPARSKSPASIDCRLVLSPIRAILENSGTPRAIYVHTNHVPSFFFKSQPQNPFFSPLSQPPPRTKNTTASRHAMAALYRAGAGARSLVRRLWSAPPGRAFGCAAAAVELDYGSEWEEDLCGADRRPGVAALALDTCGDGVSRGVQWVFMGSPVAGKRAYATRVAELLGVPYISMGTLVRQELHPRSNLYKKIANAVNEGKLVQEDIIFGLLTKRLEEGYHRGETGFILDGIPRTCIQAEILDQLADIDLVVNFKCMEDCLVKMHFGSGICSHCGKSFDPDNTESTSINPCLATRTRHSQLNSSPAMDIEGTRMEKFRIYSEQNKQLEEYYRKQGKLLDFQVAGGPGETWQGLLAALHLQHMNAANNSQKLTE